MLSDKQFSDNFFSFRFGFINIDYIISIKSRHHDKNVPKDMIEITLVNNETFVLDKIESEYFIECCMDDGDELLFFPERVKQLEGS